MKTIKEKKLEKNIIFAGNVDNIPKLLSESDIFVLPSRYEGFGLVLIEAMAVGLPCVSFDCPAGPKDIITDHIDGILVERNNVDKLAEAICFLIEHDKERQEYATQAKVSSERYRLENIMQKWIALFENVIRE